MLNWKFLFSVLAISVAPVLASAHDIGRKHNSCLKFAQRKGIPDKYIYVAWVPNYVHHCLLAIENPIKEVLKHCEDDKKRLNDFLKPQGISVREKCRVAVRSGKIVDGLYRSSVQKIQPIPVEIKIFDQKSGKLQTASALYSQQPTRYRYDNMVAWKFDVQASGVALCSGTAKTTSSGMLTFITKCFGQSLRGKANPNRLIKRGGLYYTVPEVVRVESKGSWMEMRF